MTDWNDLYEKFKNKQLGKDQLEIIKKGVVDDYNSNPDLQKLVHGIGNFYQDLRTVDGEEKYDPLSYLTAGTLRAVEGAGWLADQTAGRFLKNTIHNTLRVDPSVAEIGSQGVQMFAAPKAISKGINLLNKGIASPQAQNLAYKAGQTARRFKDKLGSVPTTAYDDAIGIFELPSEEFNQLSKLAKQPGINSLTLARRFQLQKKALQNKYGKRPDSDLQMMATPPTGGMDLGIGDTGFSYSVRKKQTIAEYRNKLFNDAGFRRNSNGDFVFDLASLKQFLKGEKRRLVSQYFQTRQSQSVKGSFEKTRDATKLDFLETYDGYMKLTGSKPNLHHEFAAMVSAPLYDGLALSETPGSEWMQLTELLNLNDIYPGSPVTDPASLGGPQSNLTQMLTKGRAGAPPEPHDILHKQFYKELGIQDVPKGQNSWWDKRMYKIKSGPKGRLEVAQEYADIVNEGNRIIKTAMSQINALFGKNQDPQKITNLMIELAETGKLKIADSKYRLKSVEAIVKIIENEVKADMGFTDEIELTKAVKKYNLDSHSDYVDAVDLLGNIADYNESMRVFGVPPKSITKKLHKENVEAYMKLTQTELELGDVETYKAREAKIEDFTYRRVNPLPINKQLEFMFPDPPSEQLELLKNENPLLE